jgi:hypothetical protein
VQEIFLLFHNFEPSRTKLWEFFRRFDPIQVCAFLYLLENVLQTPKKIPITLPVNTFRTFYKSNYRSRGLVKFRIADKLKLNLDRVCEKDRDLFSRKIRQRSRSSFIPDTNINMLELLRMVVSFSASSSSSSSSWIMNENLSVYVRIILHNLSTSMYRKCLDHVRFLLFPDNLQSDRSELKQNESIVVTFMRYYKMLTFQYYVIDPKMFRYIFVPKPLRVYNEIFINSNKNNNDDKYIIQYYYQGIYLIINASLTEQTKCFNRYGELNRTLLREKFNCDCTFEAVVVPLDAHGIPRSWRYWDYKSGYRIYKTDVFRYQNVILTNVPFAERIKYLDSIASPNSVTAKCMTTDDEFDGNFNGLDLYDHVIGKFARRANAFCCERAYVFKFPINAVFDVHKNRILDLRTNEMLRNKSLAYKNNIHVSFDTADRRTVCMAYANSEKYYYLCSYNDRLHQFEHSGDLERLPYDNRPNPNYKSSERILVLNCKERPRGILFLRVYYTKYGEIVGYESKSTTGRYDLPLTDELFDKDDDEN